jgi:hypothetical protein
MLCMFSLSTSKNASDGQSRLYRVLGLFLYILNVLMAVTEPYLSCIRNLTRLVLEWPCQRLSLSLDLQ